MYTSSQKQVLFIYLSLYICPSITVITTIEYNGTAVSPPPGIKQIRQISVDNDVTGFGAKYGISNACPFYGRDNNGRKRKSLFLFSAGRSVLSLPQQHMSNACTTLSRHDQTNFLFYNRIPKSGSTTMTNLFQNVVVDYTIKSKMKQRRGASVNKSTAPYNLLNSKFYLIKEPFKLNTNDTEGWMELKNFALQAAVPRIYINHIFWVDLVSFGLPRPFTFQIMREPSARMVSEYYYRLFGRRELRLKKRDRKYYMQMTGLSHPPTINEYIAWRRNSTEEGSSCNPFGNTQTRFFCGYDSVCENVCSTEALERAKHILVSQYDLVGFAEHMDITVQLLQHSMPHLLQNLENVYKSGLFSQNANSNPVETQRPTSESITFIRRRERQVL